MADVSGARTAYGITEPRRGEGGLPPAEVRCECGSLMARLVGNRIELKCRRCKRVVQVATDRASRGWVAVPGDGCSP